MVHIKSEPAGKIQSLHELFALAQAMSSDTAGRYASLADGMRHRGMTGVADTLDHLAQEEQRHSVEIEHWSQECGAGRPDRRDMKWPPVDSFDADDLVELSSSHVVTPYRTLSIAVQNEERVFAFWSYVAAHADEQAVRNAAENMARRQLSRMQRLRQERRHAFHLQRAQKSQDRDRSDGTEPVTAADLELRLAASLDAYADNAPQRPAQDARRLAGEARAMAQAARFLDRRFEPFKERHNLAAMSEQLVEAYLAAAADAKEDDKLRDIQLLAQSAIARLRWAEQAAQLP